MAAPEKKRQLLRAGLLLFIGAVAVMMALRYRASCRPSIAPESVQASGREIIITELARLAETEFGRSERGRMLFGRVQEFLEEDGERAEG